MKMYLSYEKFLFSFSGYDKLMVFNFRYADQVSIADEVLVEGEELTPAKVTNVSSLFMQGE